MAVVKNKDSYTAGVITVVHQEDGKVVPYYNVDALDQALRMVGLNGAADAIQNLTSAALIEIIVETLKNR